MKKLARYSFLLIASVLCGCTSTMQLVSFEQLEASQINFPESVRRVAVVNNIAPSDYTLYGTEIPVALQGDGRVAATTLAEALADAHYFDQVILCDSMRYLSDSITGIIPAQRVNELSREWGVDLIFSIDSIHITNKAFSYGYLGGEVAAFIRPQVRAYVPERAHPLFSIAKQDTLFWPINPALQSEVIAQESASYVAQQLLPFVVPCWKMATRSYYDGGHYQMRDAALHVRQGEWDEAFMLWDSIYKEAKGAMRMRAAYNMALYYETKEEMERAKALLNEASESVKPNSADASFIQFYLMQLEEREAKLAKLNIQMKRFSNNL
ncbi:MAG: DUF6340 family protein [Phocaeicola sp.]